MSPRQAPAPWVLTLCGLVLSACSPSGQEELAAWVQAERAATRPRLQALPGPVPYSPQAYAGAGLTDPFSPEKLAGTPRLAPPAPGARSALPAQVSARPKQALEAFPLESMALVGTMDSQGQRVALVRVNRQLHPVRTGAYLGQNHGRVTRITDQGLQLRERVQNASGAWIERSTTLTIQEETSP